MTSKTENCRFPEGSLLFAPMEGVTDSAYREAMMKNFSEWDYWSTDFLRIPVSSRFKPEKILSHFGHTNYQNQEILAKTAYQVLTSLHAENEYTVSQINDLGFAHLDLNLGCPSKKVYSHKGGAYLLGHPLELSVVIKKIRKSFKGCFSVKIRIGDEDDRYFLENLKIFESEGVDFITIHARTRKQLYKGFSNWDYIRKAVSLCQIPVIGNGDCSTPLDIEKMFLETQCHSVMVGRGALKTPWLAKEYKFYKQKGSSWSDEQNQKIRRSLLKIYYRDLEEVYRNKELAPERILKRFKSFCHYPLDINQDLKTIKSQMLRSQDLSQFNSLLKSI